MENNNEAPLPADVLAYDSYFDACERANCHPLPFDSWKDVGKPDTPQGR